MILPVSRVTLDDFANSFGTTAKTFSPRLIRIIEEGDFTYQQLVGKERDAVMLDVIKFTAMDKQVIGDSSRKEVWHNGWGENLKAFRAGTNSSNAIVPKFIRPNMAIRYKQDYILPNNENFELDYLTVFRDWFYDNYFADYDNIYEFGAGTGFNLVAISKLFPDKHYFGSDFVQTSVDLINELPKKFNIKLKSFMFDMLQPNAKINLQQNSAIFTFGAIEQLAGKFENFIQYLLLEKPNLCLHVEPTVELYDENNLVDYLAANFHKKRGYSQGLLPRIQELEKEGKVELIKVKRLYFGSINFEGYTLIVWKPL